MNTRDSLIYIALCTLATALVIGAVGVVVVRISGGGPL